MTVISAKLENGTSITGVGYYNQDYERLTIISKTMIAYFYGYGHGLEQSYKKLPRLNGEYLHVDYPDHKHVDVFQEYNPIVEFSKL